MGPGRGGLRGWLGWAVCVHVSLAGAPHLYPSRLDVDAVLVGTVLEDKLLQEEEGALVGHVLAHLCMRVW